MKQLLFTLLIFFIFSSNALIAQDDILFLSVSAGMALPMGEFGKNIGEFPIMTRRAGFKFGEDVGLAQAGFGLGAELFTPLRVKGFGWILSSRILINGVDGSAVESEFEQQLGDSVDVKFEFGNWINIPVMTGFRYQYSLSSKLAAYGMVLAGINLTKAPSIKAKVGEVTAEETTFDFARDFVYEVGLGFELSKKFNLGFHYLIFSSPRYEGTRKLSEKVFREIFSRENAITGDEYSITIFYISLGYYLH